MPIMNNIDILLEVLSWKLDYDLRYKMKDVLEALDRRGSSKDSLPWKSKGHNNSSI